VYQGFLEARARDGIRKHFWLSNADSKRRAGNRFAIDSDVEAECARSNNLRYGVKISNITCMYKGWKLTELWTIPDK
jgi:hypothetical protein